MELEPIKLIEFKQEINELIDKYIECFNNNIENRSSQKILSQIISYYKRMKLVYESTHSDSEEMGLSDNLVISEEDNCVNIIDEMGLSDDLVISEKDNYANIITDFTYSDNRRNEENIRRKILGLSNSIGYNVANDLDDDPNYLNKNNWDSSMDPISYISENKFIQTKEKSTVKEYLPNQHIINNSKNTIKKFESLPDIEIIDNNIIVDYEEPQI